MGEQEQVWRFLDWVASNAAHNGADDPGQRFYDWGLNPWLAEQAAEFLLSQQREERAVHEVTTFDGKTVRYHVDREPMTPFTDVDVVTCGCFACVGNVPASSTSPFLTVGMTRMIVCGLCGNKRCPHGTDHRNECTASNKPGQVGSRYAATPPEPSPTAGDVGSEGGGSAANVPSEPQIDDLTASELKNEALEVHCPWDGRETTADQCTCTDANTPGWQG